MSAIIKAQGIDIYHEVLFALSGTRSAFTSYQYAVKELFDLSEAVLLERILSLGQDYGKLKSFIDSIKSKLFDDKSKVGLYLPAFAEYLNNALEPYWDDIVFLEQEIINQPHKSIHFIWSKMHRHCELLSGLLSLVASVISQNSYGCVVLQHLHQRLSSEVGTTRAAVAIIIDGMNEIFFRQISCWLLYGELIDTREEFFIKENKVESEDTTPFNRYSLNCSRLPNHIEIRLAEKILAVGQTVLFLRSNPNGKESAKERPEICIDKGGLFGEKEKIMQEKMAYVRQICKWNENGKMEKLVTEMSSYVTLQLWTLAVQDAKLIEQLHLVNEFFLLGRGELFHDFVSQADRHLSLDRHSTLGNLNLNLLLRESARKVFMREESLARISLEIVSENLDSNTDDAEGEWSRILVKYEAPWPLQLLFTNEALNMYNKIFRFLLRLKKIEVKLGERWLFEKSKRFEQDNLKQHQLHRNLCFLISNLQYYSYVDVLNSQFVQLEEIVKSSKDFERIQKAHSIFLENLNSQLFLSVDSEKVKTKNPIKSVIIKILELCEEYCGAMQGKELAEVEEEKVKCMLESFDAFIEFLLNHLSRITKWATHPSSQHLQQFLLRLDFNSFFSNQFSSSLASVYF